MRISVPILCLLLNWYLINICHMYVLYIQERIMRRELGGEEGVRSAYELN